jgi:hypothetical protein
VADGALVYRLTWKSFVGDSAPPISETLDLAAMGDHLPISETSATATASQVDSGRACGHSLQCVLAVYTALE